MILKQRLIEAHSRANQFCVAPLFDRLLLEFVEVGVLVVPLDVFVYLASRLCAQQSLQLVTELDIVLQMISIDK